MTKHMDGKWMKYKYSFNEGSLKRTLYPAQRGYNWYLTVAKLPLIIWAWPSKSGSQSPMWIPKPQITLCASFLSAQDLRWSPYALILVVGSKSLIWTVVICRLTCICTVCVHFKSPLSLGLANTASWYATSWSWLTNALVTLCVQAVVRPTD